MGCDMVVWWLCNQLSAIGCRVSGIGYQLSAIGCRGSGVNLAFTF
jgi:hypothetical protein